MIQLVVLFQLISLKTAPVATADQFAIVPADLDGMGGAMIATRDVLADPFTNPAKGARLAAMRLLTGPSVYSVSHGSGAGRTLPLGFLGKSGSWFGGLMLGLQQVDPAKAPQQFFPPIGFGSAPASAPRSHGNSYAVLAAGRSVSDRVSLGVAARWAGLAAVDGVDQLYAGNAGLSQHGHVLDLRFGLLDDGPRGASAEALLVINRYAMTQDVTWVDTFWDPGSQNFQSTTRLQVNQDATNTLGLHLGAQRPLTPGWTVGAIATVNRLSHPHIPDYVIQSVPRDPGLSWAADFGLGVAHKEGPARFALDAVIEPAWSHTWDESRTVDNHFAFENYLLRMGVAREINVVEIQLGLAVKSIGYTLDQVDHSAQTTRSDQESWVEWTPTWGLSLRFPDLEIRYRGRSDNGTGRPFTGQSGCCFPAAPTLADAGGPSILVTPAGPLSLQNVSVVTHQISISVPLR